eukprot:CAMPEP_0172673512 /NCGR_PEP_ID=MMETSP1074-20121228/12192_1 /TAXON_ID=2916 /ORGANISM="Ceratium fusus, Strain PA161109" /LENGTH=66 /DNA_ID=CAMNT_0013490825 /DNA_START=677 /DNA_END=877 /DNA_ORIENTATION=+
MPKRYGNKKRSLCDALFAANGKSHAASSAQRGNTTKKAAAAWTSQSRTRSGNTGCRTALKMDSTTR